MFYRIAPMIVLLIISVTAGIIQAVLLGKRIRENACNPYIQLARKARMLAIGSAGIGILAFGLMFLFIAIVNF